MNTMHSSFLNLSETVSLLGDLFGIACLQNDFKRSLLLKLPVHSHTSETTGVDEMVEQIMRVVIFLSTNFHLSEQKLGKEETFVLRYK